MKMRLLYNEELDNLIINYLMKIIIRMKFSYMKKVELAELFMIINNSVIAN